VFDVDSEIDHTEYLAALEELHVGPVYVEGIESLRANNYDTNKKDEIACKTET
jgi:hypothetical protein